MSATVEIRAVFTSSELKNEAISALRELEQVKVQDTSEIACGLTFPEGDLTQVTKHLIHAKNVHVQIHRNA